MDIVKRGDNYLLRPSLVELQQKATKQYDLVNAPIVTPTPSTTPVDSSLTDIVLKYIPTPVTRSQLRQLKQDFKFARMLEFYTDGSMMTYRTDQCVMGIGWIQVDTDNDIPPVPSPLKCNYSPPLLELKCVLFFLHYGFKILRSYHCY